MILLGRPDGEGATLTASTQHENACPGLGIVIGRFQAASALALEHVPFYRIGARSRFVVSRYASRQWSGVCLLLRCRTRATSGRWPCFLAHSIASCCVFVVAST